MRHIEAELIGELEQAMRRAGKTQAEFATFKGASRQAVNPYFTGKKALLTDTALELFEFLGVRVKLEPIEP
ncbi:helix-turn-helix domain-containing protein [Deinococcus gobiensis]|nr:helix-turn-helix transcriptional regulator [Deinococcus gobiensis]